MSANGLHRIRWRRVALYKNRTKKNLPSHFINVFRDAVHFKPEVTTGGYVRARASLTDERIPVLPGLSCLLVNVCVPYGRVIL